MQELFVSQIANELRIPVPGCAILNLEQDFLNDNKDLQFKYHLTPGLYFGSEALSNVESNIVPEYKKAIVQKKPRIVRSWNTFFRNVSNSEVYSSIIALDLLTANFDRFSNEGNILVVNSNKERKVYALDFGHCFTSPYWNNQKARFMQTVPEVGENYSDYVKMIVSNYIGESNMPLVPLGTIFHGMQNNIFFEKGNPFKNIISKIEGISTEKLVSFLQQIPKDWVVGRELQINMYVHFIERNKFIVKYMLNSLYDLGAFSNSIGGQLLWKTEDINYGIQ